ncbi:MAG: hypothetical protein ACXAC8_07305 [Candidatus Hodarchaeales archaeon]
MIKKDFEFLRRKEFLILFCFLLLISFFQMALEQQIRSGLIHSYSTLNLSLFESLGLFLPLFVMFFLAYSELSRKDYSMLPPLRWWVFFFSILLFILLVPLPKALEEEFNENFLNNTTSTTIPETSSLTTIITDTSSPPLIGSSVQETNLFEVLLLDLRSVFIFGMLFIPFLVLLIITRRKNHANITAKKSDIIDEEYDDSRYKARTIIECYYQASNSLEERGANDSPSLTPKEFTKDVNEKNLCRFQLIKDLSNLYEEAKFSTHELSTQQIVTAKSLASEIIYPPDSTSEVENENTLEQEEN